MEYIDSNDTSHEVKVITRNSPFYANPTLVITADNDEITVDRDNYLFDIVVELTDYNTNTTTLPAKYEVINGVMYLYFDLNSVDGDIYTYRVIGSDIDDNKVFYVGSLKAE